MKWGAFFATAIVSIIIVLFQWPKMKQTKKKDKAAFIILLLIGLSLSMLNLPYIPGPVKWIEHVFKPFTKILEK